MPNLGIDINDSALTLASASATGPGVLGCDGAPLSPGYVGSGGRFGHAARALAKRSAHQASDEAWQRLTSEPASSLGEALGGTWAQLAQKHLAALYTSAAPDATALFATPATWIQGGYSDRLLHAARASGVPTAGLLDRALASAALGHTHGLAPGSPVYHLDLLRGAAELCTLTYDGKTLCSDQAPSMIASSGFRDLEDLLMGAIESLMVEEFGVFPSANPELEQALFDQLPSVLETLHRSSSATLDTGSSSTTITRDDASASCRKLSDRLRAGVEAAFDLDDAKGSRLLKLGPFAALVPGLREALGSIRGLVVEELPMGHAALGAAHLCEAMGLQAIDRDATPAPIAELPAALLAGYEALTPIADAAVVSAVSQAEAQVGRQFRTGPGGFLRRDRPTHILFQGRAIPLEGSPFFVGGGLEQGQAGIQIDESFAGLGSVHAQLTRANGAWRVEPGAARVPVLVNRQPIDEPTPLETGDIITLGTTGLKAMLVHTLD